MSYKELLEEISNMEIPDLEFKDTSTVEEKIEDIRHIVNSLKNVILINTKTTAKNVETLELLSNNLEQIWTKINR